MLPECVSLAMRRARKHDGRIPAPAFRCCLSYSAISLLLVLLLFMAVRLESCTDHSRVHHRCCAALRLRGGSAAVWEAIENAVSEIDGQRVDGDDEDGEALHDIDMEELLKDYEGKTSWEKLKNYIGSLQDTYGEEEVDNVGIEELG